MQGREAIYQVDQLPATRGRRHREGPGRYNLYLGGTFDGSRLSKLYAEDLDHAAIIAKLNPVFAAYAGERKPGERFGAFVIRAGIVAPTTNGADFHANTGAQRAV
jgi:sulfite reductase (NADPH) hemoprotein beta-component